MVMRSGADSEMTSGVSGTESDLIRQAPGIRRDGQTALASSELYVIIDLPKISTGTPANVPMRGIGPQTLAVRDNASIVEGRMLRVRHQRGGGRTRRQRAVPGPDPRQRDPLGAEHLDTWSASSRPTAASTRPRSGATSGCCRAPIAAATPTSWCVARLDSSDTFDTFRDWLTANPQLNVQVRRETEYYAQQSRALSQPDPDGGLRHRRADGHRRGVRRHPDDVHGGRRRGRARSPRCARSASTPARWWCR